MLEHLGFNEVTELTFGARMVNWAYANYIKENPAQKIYIASPCPTVVAMIQTQYPELAQYLMPIVSPVAAMARIYKQKNPDSKVVFISPCWAKENVEAPKYPDCIDAVITLKDLKDIFEKKCIKEADFNKNYKFDSLIREYTKIYPISGGLASTSHIKSLFNEGEILITDGVANIKKALDDFKAGDSKYRFFDILNCDGGCIGGPAICNQFYPIEKRKEIVYEYTHRSSEDKMGERHKGTVQKTENIDMSANL